MVARTPNHKCFFICYFTNIFVLENAGYENFDADEYKDYAAEDARLACKVCACALADIDADKAYYKGYDGNNDGGDNCGEKIVARYGKADRKRIDGGCYALQNKRSCGKTLATAFLALAFTAVVNHFTADKAKKRKCDPRNKGLKGLKIL